jgi:hypothetical protein
VPDSEAIAILCAKISRLLVTIRRREAKSLNNGFMGWVLLKVGRFAGSPAKNSG